MLDVVQISYYEPFADENFEILQLFAPHAKRIQGVKGIFAAHKEAAKIAETNNFYVVDADAVIQENFNFNFNPSSTVEEYPTIMQNECIHVYRSVNPVNDLLYGYGGVKLFPRKKLLKARKWNVDMTTTLNAPFVAKMEISNITGFNTTPFDAWKSAFRECAKLASTIIPYADNYDNSHRLNIWCTRGAGRLNGKYCIMGANQGKDFGEYYRGNLKALKKINDFDWLKAQFMQVKNDISS